MVCNRIERAFANDVDANLSLMLAFVNSVDANLSLKLALIWALHTRTKIVGFVKSALIEAVLKSVKYSLDYESMFFLFVFQICGAILVLIFKNKYMSLMSLELS